MCRRCRKGTLAMKRFHTAGSAGNAFVRHGSMTDDCDTQRRVIALASAVVVTLGFLASLDRLMSDQSRESLPKPEYIETRLIDRTIPAEPIAPLKSQPASRATPASAITQTRRAVEPQAALSVAPSPQQPLDLFTRDGAVRLPADPQNSLAPKRVDGAVMSHKDLMPAAPERFAWAKPANETLGDALMRKIYNHKWKLPWGTVVSCIQGVATRETPIVIECRPGEAGATSDELRAMRADPPAEPAKAHPNASFARREHGSKGREGKKTSFASLRY